MSMQVGFVFHLDEPLSSDFFNTALKRTNGSSLQRRHLHIRPFLATNPSITSMWITGAKILAAAILGIGGPGKVDEKVSEWIESAVDKIGQAYGVAFEEGISDYIRDYLLQLVEKDHAIHTLTCDADNIIVGHHALPDAQPKIIPQPVEPNPIEAREKLREGEIDHIVFLMMENRSFDHMLGYRSLKGKVVNGLTGNETNSIPENNPPYTVHHLTQTRGIPTPPHDHDRGGGH